ncbi:MAG TPA: DUF6445 family protein [Rhodanobacteraceae bacterium]|jgi:hypothetical protein|nr:DUF6445 family protein [Rhodanobacteraceae bacterium]
MLADAPFNPRPKIEHLELANGQVCHVIDDALLDPSAFVEWAAARREEFRIVDFNAYPGDFLMTPATIQKALEDFFVAHIRQFFDARRLVKMHCRLSMVTLPPEKLRPYQWLCHTDRSGLDATQSIQASVLYLFKDPALGGTSFYTPARPTDEIARLFADTTQLSNAAFAERWGIEPGYIGDSNAYFTRIGGVEARFNRLIFYDGSMLHSGDIPDPKRLSNDPTRGRLTFNGFFVSRRRAA